jgi:hypothetical protein
LEARSQRPAAAAASSTAVARLHSHQPPPAMGFFRQVGKEHK